MTVGPVLDFNPVRTGPFDSGPAFSDSDVRSFVFRSYIFQSCTFQPGHLVRHFPVLRFQSPRSGLCRFSLLVPVIVISLPRGRSVVPAMSSRGGSRSHKRCTHTHFSLSLSSRKNLPHPRSSREWFHAGPTHFREYRFNSNDRCYSPG